MAGRDVWASGDAYEPYVGRWSRLVAVAFLDWLAVPSGRRWIDIGCGTGALTRAILDSCDPAAVVGVDRSADYVAWAKGHVDDPRARFEVAGIADVAAWSAASADVVVSGLVLNFFPDPAEAVAAMRAAAPRG